MKSRDAQRPGIEASPPVAAAPVAPPGDAAVPGQAPAPGCEDGLVQRCRESWRRGDWAALAAIPLAEAERHPERARIALMLASAHLAQGSYAETRSFAGKALQWGCDRASIARVLLACVHDTIGRAAAASGQMPDRAARNFALAVEPGSSRTRQRLALQARIEAQLAELGLPHELWPILGCARPALQQPVGPLRSTPAPDGLHEALHAQGEALRGRLDAQAGQLARLHEALTKTVVQEVGKAVKQVQAHAGLVRYLGGVDWIPELHGWAISADFGMLLVGLVESNDYDLIVEFGSGASTLLLARAAERLAPRRAQDGRPPTAILTLEHLEEYHRQTLALLVSAGLEHRVRLALAPIRPFTTAAGRTFPYYDARAAVAECVAGAGRPAQTLRVLLVVDGPPAATGPLARYPAVALALEFLDGAAIDILLDDYRRDDEKKVAQAWLDELAARGLQPGLTAFALEKDACLVRVPRRSPPPPA